MTAYLLMRTVRAACCSCLDSAGKKHALQLKAVRADTLGSTGAGPTFAPAKAAWACFVLANAAILNDKMDTTAAGPMQRVCLASAER